MAAQLTSDKQPSHLPARNVWLLVNPRAGRGRADAVGRQLELELQRRGHAVEKTDRPPLEARCALRPDVVIAVGGDGTQRVVVQRLFDLFGNDVPPLLPVAMGTANLLAQYLDQPQNLGQLAMKQIKASLPGPSDLAAKIRRGLRKHSELARSPKVSDAARTLSSHFSTRPRTNRTLASQVADAVERDRRVRLDVPSVNGERFLLMCGVGLDASVVEEVHANRRGPITLLQYALPAMSAALRYDFPRVDVTVDGKRLWRERGIVMVSNVPQYGTGYPLAPGALGDDGLLDVVCLPCLSRIDLLQWLARITSGQHVHHHDAFLKRGRQIELAGDGAIPAQVDGDPGGKLPVAAAMDGASIELVRTATT